jgi:dipeptidyl aminopeptidase/acylaminoacyl peptidase
MLSDLTADIQDPEMMVAYVDPVPRANLTMPHSPNDSVNAELYAKRKAEIDKTLKSRLFVTQYSKPEFSHNGNRLIIGLGSYIAPDDTTIYDFERADLDIWRWDSPMTPPQENKNVNKLREKTYPYVIDLSNNDGVLLTNNPLVKVVEGNRWDSNYAMLCDPSDSAISRQWDYYSPEKIYVVNVNNGQRKEVATVGSELAEISTGGNYIIWYADRNYYSYNIASGETVCISEKIPYPIWDEDQDTPSIREPYGTSLWYEGDKALLINDRYDIWKVDPSGKSDPICLTAGEGRKTNRKFRYTALNKDDHRFITPGETLMLRVFDFNNKDYGFATVKSDKSSAPKISDIGPYFVSQLRKAKDNDVYTYQRANFSTSPDAWISVSNNFASAKRVSDINPQMKDYNWGTAELVKWYAYNGDLTEGILYKPEDFDPAKKYPMIVYFYETNSELLNYHYDFEPSWSWINFPFYTSRGYLIFVPDVHYAAGIPGESAYNYICSGVEDLCKRYDWIDKSKIGIDGQSWGGYQTAYLSTRTNMFACAGSGAPVANMTSAFGGIRWESGDSRQAQYEQGQSRIGRNIWEAPELYIANSPVFHADRINNPILIMHNDADGAVPWYQGIELFMALRRLEKPVWMLQYNGEAHNLKERRNRKDITIRLQQFFDHYLKDAPMPEWMKNGIPAVRKGQEFGTTLTE